MFRWGELSVAVTSASITSLIDAVNRRGIYLKEIQYVDDLNICLSISASDYLSLRSIAQKHGDDVRILHSTGGYYFLLNLLKRPVILCVIVLWLFLVLFLPGRVLFFCVEGNQTVSDYEILSAAEQCGVQFGATRRYIKSEKVKNSLLSQIEQLKWVGVNTKGCVATISVQERAIPSQETGHHSFGNVIASTDGVITNITVTSGTPLCKVGQAVRKGQILVSGYTDCGLHIKSVEVDAEVYGITRRDVSAIAMYPHTLRGEVKSVKSYYSIQIGKNIIKLNKYSGILDTGCVKMYEKKFLTLPGNFYLPVSFVKETVIAYDPEQISAVDRIETDWVEGAVRNACTDNMLAGEILHGTTEGTYNENGYNYSGYYICKELIGQVCTEEMFIDNGKRNG